MFKTKKENLYTNKKSRGCPQVFLVGTQGLEPWTQ